MLEDNEKELFELFKQNKDKALQIIMNKYQKPVYWHIRRLVVVHEDAEDIFQEVFINVYKYFNKFRGDSKLSTWIYSIATNECLRFFEKKQKQLTINNTLENYFASKLSEYDSESADDIVIKFQKAIMTLPKKQRAAFNLRYYDELSYEEISEITGISVKSLKTNYHYAKEKIKTYMINNSK
jgi:RNA polymerase sigma-70 factor (ECF subfamily)